MRLMLWHLQLRMRMTMTTSADKYAAVKRLVFLIGFASKQIDTCKFLAKPETRNGTTIDDM